jgi:hypothetical protein
MNDYVEIKSLFSELKEEELEETARILDAYLKLICQIHNRTSIGFASKNDRILHVTPSTL